MKKTKTVPVTTSTEPKLELRILKFEKSLLIQILNQTKMNIKPFKSKYGLYIKSYSLPQLTIDSFYIRGSAKDRDFVPAYLGFDTNSKRDKYLKSLLESLKDWSENSPDFKVAEPSNTQANIEESIVRF